MSDSLAGSAAAGEAGKAKKPHTLVVGGTGMLRDLCLALALRGHVVSVIAQNVERLEALRAEAEKHGGVIHPLPVDYGHAIQLANRITWATGMYGPLSLAVCWVHSDSPQALPTIAGMLRKNSEAAKQRGSETAKQGRGMGEAGKKDDEGKPRLFHLIGSADIKPAARAAIEEFSRRVPEVAWRRVLLGFKTTPTGTRWLTNREIWEGTLAAIENDWVESVIGVTGALEGRPG